MKNTMVRGGDGQLGKKRGKKKGGKLHLKRGKGLKNASFWAINSKRKKEENYIKKGGKALKMHLFGQKISPSRRKHTCRGKK